MKRTNRILPISPGYDAFVKPGSGVIEREFGPFEEGAFRLDVSGEIVDGDSWQLAVFVAHALDAKGRLAAPDDGASTAVLLTGRVDYDLNVLPVEFVSKKLAAARDEFTELQGQGVSVSVFVPTENLGDIDAPNLPDGVKVVAADTTGKLLDKLGVIQPKTGPGDAAAAPASNLMPPSLQPSAGSLDPPAARPRSLWWAFGTMLVLLLTAAAVVIWYPRIMPYLTASAPPDQTDQLPPSPPPVNTENSASEKEDASVEEKPPLQAGEIGSAPSEETLVKTEAAPETEEQVAAASNRIEITLFGRHAPDGQTCAAVHFGSATAVLVPIPSQDQNESATSRHAGLCGLEFVVESFGEPRYVSVVLDIKSGRFLDTPPLPVGLTGNMPFQGRKSWSVDIPYRMKQALEYRFAAIASENPLTDDAVWLSAQPNWEGTLSELTSREIEIVWTTHRVLP